MSVLDERSRKILWAVTKSYIASNGPVGSRTVTRKYSFALSPATIRNTMADLEELGYITQPYTSAGRIPTERGYRLYVNSILKKHSLAKNKRKRLLKQLSDNLPSIEKDVYKLIKEVSKTLSALSHYLGVATPPKEEDITLKRIEFIRHERKKVFGILISEEGIIKNKIIYLEELFTQKQLNKIVRYLNNELTGLTLGEIRIRIVSQISREKTICNELIINALMLCKKLIEWETENMFHIGEISGTANLPDFANMKQIKELFRAIEDKHLMIKLLDKMTGSEGVQVLIGSENTISEMKELSMVGSTYNDGNRTLGTIGVIGPTRMDYEMVIPIVDLTAKTLTQILSER
ncbi:MAG: heat-inducible transcriptional repressor HrcA [Thermodesulfovibrionia bacterium]|nr:MAG: heat-inducible transcriptional repressor HrcA [Thermodesulfovibrionia bacterium]